MSSFPPLQQGCESKTVAVRDPSDTEILKELWEALF